MYKFLLFFAITLSGCASQAERYYIKSNLNDVYTGQPKEQFLKVFPGQEITSRPTPPPITEAQKNNKPTDILEVLLADGTVSHWFLFEDDALVQWRTPNRP